MLLYIIKSLRFSMLIWFDSDLYGRVRSVSGTFRLELGAMASHGGAWLFGDASAWGFGLHLEGL